MLEDLVAAAFNAAVRKAEETSAEKMGKITAGMPGLPGGMKFLSEAGLLRASHASLGGARNPHDPQGRSGCCAPSA
jgi:hypothetical protein